MQAWHRSAPRLMTLLTRRGGRPSPTTKAPTTKRRTASPDARAPALRRAPTRSALTMTRAGLTLAVVTVHVAERVHGARMHRVALALAVPATARNRCVSLPAAAAGARVAHSARVTHWHVIHRPKTLEPAAMQMCPRAILFRRRPAHHHRRAVGSVRRRAQGRPHGCPHGRAHDDSRDRWLRDGHGLRHLQLRTTDPRRTHGFHRLPHHQLR